jgi:hypothetical protein
MAPRVLLHLCCSVAIVLVPIVGWAGAPHKSQKEHKSATSKNHKGHKDAASKNDKEDKSVKEERKEAKQQKIDQLRAELARAREQIKVMNGYYKPALQHIDAMLKAQKKADKEAQKRAVENLNLAIANINLSEEALLGDLKLASNLMRNLVTEGKGIILTPKLEAIRNQTEQNHQNAVAPWKQRRDEYVRELKGLGVKKP